MNITPSDWIDLEDDEQQRLVAEERLVLDVTELLYELLERSGITQAELAKRIGVNASEVSQRLSGRRNLTLRSLADMSYAMGATVHLHAEAISHQASGWPHSVTVPLTERSYDWPGGRRSNSRAQWYAVGNVIHFEGLQQPTSTRQLARTAQE